ncbi:hypothetical protein QUF90_27030 [Desulfococcaceae bacterium HSG9]|nr:hypothetical protein [Desulfococcaceae bacterium HSG9]
MEKNEIKEIYFSKIITEEEVMEAAESTGFIQRKGGKIHPFDFITVLIFRLATSVPPSLRLMTSLLMKPASRSGIHQKFTERAVSFLQCCLQTVIAKRIAQNRN